MSAIFPTPGPWQVKHDFDIEGSTTVIGNVDGEIIEGTAHHTYDFVARTLDLDDDSQSHSIAVANARAIAALPDLLTALEPFQREYLDMGLGAHLGDEQLVRDVDEGSDVLTVGHWRKLMAALRSATGAA